MSSAHLNDHEIEERLSALRPSSSSKFNDHRNKMYILKHMLMSASDTTPKKKVFYEFMVRFYLNGPDWMVDEMKRTKDETDDEFYLRFYNKVKLELCFEGTWAIFVEYAVDKCA